MTIKEIICSAAKLLSRADIAAAISAGELAEGEIKETAETLLYCVNAVEDELSRRYFTVTYSEKLTSPGGNYPFSSFSRAPISVLSVKASGGDVAFTTTNNSLICAAPSVTVTYRCAAASKTLGDESEFPGLSAELVALGAAAEYCLIQGDITQSENFEKRYREGIAAARDCAGAKRIPPRRWV